MVNDKPTQSRGTKREVMKGIAKCTAGGLMKNDLMRNPKTGKIVSKLQHQKGKALQKKNSEWSEAVKQRIKEVKKSGKTINLGEILKKLSAERKQNKKRVSGKKKRKSSKKSCKV